MDMYIYFLVFKKEMFKYKIKTNKNDYIQKDGENKQGWGKNREESDAIFNVICYIVLISE